MGDWESPQYPGAEHLSGRYTDLIRLQPQHSEDLFSILAQAPESIWTYMSFGPFQTPKDLEGTLQSLIDQPGWWPYLIRVDGQPLGFLSYLRIDPPNGVIEIGSIVFSPPLQRTRAATESIFLLLEHAFDTGYRRVEWKCDALNETSRRAAVRLGFTYEGTFRQATHYKGRNRDTAWFGMGDGDWPAIRACYQKWLSSENFDSHGLQKESLSSLTERVVA